MLMIPGMDDESVETKADGGVFDPPKLLRIASLAREVLEELRKMDPATTPAEQFAGLYLKVKKQLESALPKELIDELESIQLDLPFADGATQQEVLVAYSGLIGWLGGLFQGLQASVQSHVLELAEKSTAEAAEAAEAKPKEGYL